MIQSGCIVCYGASVLLSAVLLRLSVGTLRCWDVIQMDALYQVGTSVSVILEPRALSGFDGDGCVDCIE